MRKALLLLFIFIFSTINLFSSIDDQIKVLLLQDPSLIVGSGLAETKSEADQLALEDLTSQIIVKVEKEFEDRAEEDGISVKEYCKKVVKTYTNVELVGAKKLEEQVGNKYKVCRYITEKEKNKIFADRKTQIIEHLSEGEIALGNNNITDFLRNYYWALMLLKSHPEAKTMTYYFDSRERPIHTAVPSEMEAVLKDIEINLVNIVHNPGANYSELVLEATYNNEQISGLLVSYHNGHCWTETSKWTNGIEHIQLTNLVLDNQSELPFKIDYTFANHSFTGVINNTLGNLPLVNLMYAEKRVSLSKKNIQKHEVNNKEELISFSKSIKQEQKNTIINIISAISDKDLVSVRKHFTAEGFQQFNALMGYGHAVVTPTKTKLEHCIIADNEIIRSLPMKFSFTSSNEPFNEDVNFIFGENNKVEGISFALSSKARKDIANKDFATDEEKAIIINFLEQYKTAYCLKDLDFIENVFSNDALIIVGRVVRSQPDQINDMLYGQLNKATVEYVTLNKKDYIDRISQQFSKKEFININFSDNSIDRVMRSNKKVYGIQIAQYYYSSNYADEGYLFLMFDLEDIDHPKIMVRSWQPEKNPDGSIIGIEDFHWE